MSETKFTKGEWSIDVFRSSNEVLIGTSELKLNSGYRICKLLGTDKNANAHLIAATPKMYKKLEWLADYFGQQDSKFGVDMAQEIEQLLAEARGES